MFFKAQSLWSLYNIAQNVTHNYYVMYKKGVYCSQTLSALTQQKQKMHVRREIALCFLTFSSNKREKWRNETYYYSSNTTVLPL